MSESSQVPHDQPSPSAATPSNPATAPDSRVAGADDISAILERWTNEANSKPVRKIVGHDGKPKLQMRLELGLFQMELTGRPDGTRPEGCESLLDFHEQQLTQHRSRHSSDSGFHLTREQCRGLREEATLYYHRYLSLFELGEFDGVVRDTARNIRVLDLCSRFALSEADRLMMEVYRPYIVMMNTRARANLLLAGGKTLQAYKTTRKALRSLKEHFEHHGHPEAYAASGEVRVLRRIARQLKSHLPVDPMEQLMKDLRKAIAAENYERAAEIRDKLKALEDAVRRSS